MGKLLNSCANIPMGWHGFFTLSLSLFKMESERVNMLTKLDYLSG